MSELECVRLYAAASASIADIITGETITWTDITDFVLFAQGVSAQRGRAAEAESTSAGTLSFAVKTKPDGSKASLSFGTPVRLGWDDGVQVHDVWLGSVAEIRQGWAGGVRGVQQVSCTDAVTALERVKLEAWPVQVAKSLGVGIDWLLPLDDDTTERPPRDVSGSVRPPQLQARPVGVPADNTSLVMGQGTSPGSPAGDAESSVATFPAWYGGGWAWVDDAAPGVGSPFDCTLSCYVKVSEVNPTYGDMVAVSTRNWLGAAGAQYIDVGIDTDGKPYAEWTYGFTSSVRLEASEPVALNKWHHVALTSNEEVPNFATVNLWVDGVAVDTRSDFDTPIPAGGLSIGASIESGKRAFAGQVSTVCLFTDDLNSTDIGKLAAVTGELVVESTVTRFGQLLKLAGLPSGGLISDTHRGTMGFQSIKGKSLAELLNEISRVEHAPWYVRRDGEVVLASRAERWNLAAGNRLPVNVATGSEDGTLTGWYVQATSQTTCTSETSPAGSIRSGSRVAKMVKITASNMTPRFGYNLVGTAALSEVGAATSASPGQTWTASAWVSSDVSTDLTVVILVWGDASGAVIGSAVASAEVTLSSTPQLASVTAVAPAGTARVGMAVARSASTTATGYTVYADELSLRQEDAADIDLPASTVDPSTSITESVRGMVNVLTVSRQGGFTATLRDADSIAAYGEIDGSVSWAAGSDAEAETYAAAMLERESQPTQDTDSLTVDVTASQASLTLLDVCRAEVGEVIEVTGLPDDAPASTQWFFVEGVSDRMSPSGWQRTFNTSAVPADTSVWVLGSSDLDTETRLGL